MAALLVISGCQTTTAPDQQVTRRIETPQALYDWGVARGLAQQISKNCPGFGFNAKFDRKTLQNLEKSLKAQGYTEKDLRVIARHPPKEKIQKDTIAYIQSNRIIIGDRSTFCRAGAREIASGSQIGKFLIAR